MFFAIFDGWIWRVINWTVGNHPDVLNNDGKLPPLVMWENHQKLEIAFVRSDLYTQFYSQILAAQN